MRKEYRHRRRKQAERKAFCILASMILVLGGSLLFYIKGQGTERRDRIGKVDFSLVEPLGDKLYQEGSTIKVEPGQRLAKDPTICLEKHSEPSYLRVRILFGGLSGQMREELEEGLDIKRGWVKNPKDGYYYYQYPVKGGEAVCFFDTLTVPENWETSSQKISFCMDFHVEAAEAACVEALRDTCQKISGWMTA